MSHFDLPVFGELRSKNISTPKNYLRDNLKYKAHILKYVPCIFSFLRSVYNLLKMKHYFQGHICLHSSHVFRCCLCLFSGSLSRVRNVLQDVVSLFMRHGSVCTIKFLYLQPK